ncbi:MAG: SMI1/KNR4 family protein [Polyangiales bacterium]
MKEDTWQRLERMLGEHRESLVAGPQPRALVEEAIRRLGRPLWPDYVEFLVRYGGAMVGADPIFGLGVCDVMSVDDTVDVQTRRFRQAGWPGAERALVVSTDSRGNPVFLCDDGRIRTFDHDSGETVELCDGFESFVSTLALGRQ